MENTEPTQPIVPQPEPQSVQNPTSSSKMKWVLVAGVLAVVILTFLGGVYFLNKNKNSEVAKITPASNSARVTPTSTLPESNVATSTANWKTYSDRAVGFSVQYPSDWKVVKEAKKFPTDADVYDLTSSNYKEIENPKPFSPLFSEGTKFSILTQKNSNFQSYEEYKKFLENSPSGQTKGYANEKEIYIDNVKVLLLTGGKAYGDSNSYTAAVYTFVNGRDWFLYLVSKQNQEQLFNQILSIFKFTQ